MPYSEALVLCSCKSYITELVGFLIWTCTEELGPSLRNLFSMELVPSLRRPYTKELAPYLALLIGFSFLLNKALHYGIIFTFKGARNSVTSLMRREAPHCGVSSLLNEALHHGNIFPLKAALQYGISFSLCYSTSGVWWTK